VDVAGRTVRVPPALGNEATGDILVRHRQLGFQLGNPLLNGGQRPSYDAEILAQLFNDGTDARSLIVRVLVGWPVKAQQRFARLFSLSMPYPASRLRRSPIPR
jgi:hypothetical protein